ncbi:MAG: hypothetical protein FWE27_08325 [Defluviitaleaceae bacterium]|nr:hypothetical protein [Defluviitaleaceae bacterium]
MNQDAVCVVQLVLGNTCADNCVTIRPMSHVNEGLTIYLQTGEYYLKTQQIRTNPNVAMCVGTYEIKGVAQIIGYPMDEANHAIIEKIKTKHHNAFERWSALPNQVLVKVEIVRVSQWRYVDGKPIIAIGQFKNN